METWFLLLASVCKESNCKSSGQTILIEMSFNVETVLIWDSVMFDNCVAFCQSHEKVANVLSYTSLELK